MTICLCFSFQCIDVGLVSLTADPGGPGICAFILTLFSFLLILATFPLSLCFSVKVSGRRKTLRTFMWQQPLSGAFPPFLSFAISVNAPVMVLNNRFGKRYVPLNPHWEMPCQLLLTEPLNRRASLLLGPPINVFRNHYVSLSKLNLRYMVDSIHEYSCYSLLLKRHLNLG